jgi:hypothetical protein
MQNIFHNDIVSLFITYFSLLLSLQMNNDDKAIYPICKNKLKEHSELQDKICNMVIIKQFATNCPGFDVQFRPLFEKGYEEQEDD